VGDRVDEEEEAAAASRRCGGDEEVKKRVAEGKISRTLADQRTVEIKLHYERREEQLESRRSYNPTNGLQLQDRPAIIWADVECRPYGPGFPLT
jgi:hypothetical protein